jgi:hypothetical protein
MMSLQDLRNIPRFKSQTVMAIKAPPEAKLHVPHPSEGLQIHMSSENGEIEVTHPRLKILDILVPTDPNSRIRTSD